MIIKESLSVVQGWTTFASQISHSRRNTEQTHSKHQKIGIAYKQKLKFVINFALRGVVKLQNNDNKEEMHSDNQILEL